MPGMFFKSYTVWRISPSERERERERGLWHSYLEDFLCDGLIRKVNRTLRVFLAFLHLAEHFFQGNFSDLKVLLAKLWLKLVFG